MLGEQIRRFRQVAGKSQVRMAQDLGVTKQCISNWENNNILPSVDMLIKLAKYFSVSTDCLLGLDDRQTLDVTGLTDEQVCHIRQIIGDILGS